LALAARWPSATWSPSFRKPGGASAELLPGLDVQLEVVAGEARACQQVLAQAAGLERQAVDQRQHGLEVAHVRGAGGGEARASAGRRAGRAARPASGRARGARGRRHLEAHALGGVERQREDAVEARVVARPSTRTAAARTRGSRSSRPARAAARQSSPPAAPCQRQQHLLARHRVAVLEAVVREPRQRLLRRVRASTRRAEGNSATSSRSNSWRMLSTQRGSSAREVLQRARRSGVMPSRQPCETASSAVRNASCAAAGGATSSASSSSRGRFTMQAGR
jgi:hypothetical protein